MCAEYLKTVNISLAGMVAIKDISPQRAMGKILWTWADEARNIRTRQCLCCGRPGHYQETVEAYMAVHGAAGMAILVDDDGYVRDGHHRVVAAICLGIEQLPTETNADAQARWVRDHGCVDWHHRRFGDR